MLSDNATACIFAWNESARIMRCIDNFSGLFKILVVDNFSTDGTKDLVEKAGYRCVSIKNTGFIETPGVMDLVEAAIDTEYLLIASVSEFIPLALLRKYAEVANQESYDIVRAYRVSVTAGEPVPISGRPTRRFPGELRFFRKGTVDYRNNQVHDRGRVVCSPERVLKLVTEASCHFYQFRDYDCSRTDIKVCGYNDVLAKQAFDAGVRFSWFWMIVKSSKQFLDSYVRFGSWRYGMLGFIHSFIRWYMEIGIWFRIWEWQNDLSSEGVKRANNAVRYQLEQEFLEQKNKEAIK